VGASGSARAYDNGVIFNLSPVHRSLAFFFRLSLEVFGDAPAHVGPTE